jgi:hypothetical protein
MTSAVRTISGEQKADLGVSIFPNWSSTFGGLSLAAPPGVILPSELAVLTIDNLATSGILL